MRQSRKHRDMEHKKPQKVKKYQKPRYKLDELLKDPHAKEANWQLEERKWKEKSKNQLR